MTLAILFSLKTMESLENGLQTQSETTPLFSMRAILLVLSQSCCSVDSDARCKRALMFSVSVCSQGHPYCSEFWHTLQICSDLFNLDPTAQAPPPPTPQTCSNLFKLNLTVQGLVHYVRQAGGWHPARIFSCYDCVLQWMEWIHNEWMCIRKKIPKEISMGIGEFHNFWCKWPRDHFTSGI